MTRHFARELAMEVLWATVGKPQQRKQYKLEINVPKTTYMQARRTGKILELNKVPHIRRRSDAWGVTFGAVYQCQLLKSFKLLLFICNYTARHMGHG